MIVRIIVLLHTLTVHTLYSDVRSYIIRYDVIRDVDCCLKWAESVCGEEGRE